MDIILLERISHLGQIGDIVSVKDGYARNFLLPQGKALRANEANKKHFEAQRVQLEARNLERKNEAQKIAEKLDGKSFIIIRSAGETGQLYGSVSTRDISEVIIEDGVSIERRQVILNHPIKTIGLHSVTINLHPEVQVSVMINIARSANEAQHQTEGENIAPTDITDDIQKKASQVEEINDNNNANAKNSLDREI